jgi:hypothetical protein
MAARRTSPAYYVAVVLLGGLLLTAVVLIVAMITRPGAPDASVIAVTDRVAVDCTQQPQHTSTCFDTQVTNNGSASSTFQCEVRPTDSALATFVEGRTTTQILLGVDQSVHLQTIVATPPSSDPSPPAVTCEPAPSA